MLCNVVFAGGAAQPDERLVIHVQCWMANLVVGTTGLDFSDQVNCIVGERDALYGECTFVQGSVLPSAGCSIQMRLL